MRYIFEDYVLDTGRRELSRDAGLIPLAPQAFDLLNYVIRNRDRVVSKDDLVSAIWGGRIISDSALTTRINAARNAVGDSGEQQRLIKTLPRKGIRFVGVVREEAQGAGVAETHRTSPPPLPDKPSIAILSFINMSGDPEQDYFADGVAEEIITALSRCNSLFVIARNSSFTFKGKVTDVRLIGQELGVGYVLEGSIRRSGNRLRITGQLVKASSGAHIWADRFEGHTSEIFDLQDRITESVVAVIEPQLQLAEIERLKHKAEFDFDAYDLLLQAQALEYEFTEASLAAAIQCLEKALAIAPSFAPAMALAAYCHAELHNQGWTDTVETDAAKGLALASRALDLGKNDANVLWMAAFVMRALGADPYSARELLDRSLQLNPNSAIALTTAGWNEAMLGNPVKALELLRRAERLSPRDPRAWYMASAAALAHFAAGRFEDAAVCAKRALAQNPRFTRTLRVLAASLAKLGDKESASRVMQEMLTIEPHLTIAKLQWRLRHMEKKLLSRFLEGLQLAGLPD